MSEQNFLTDINIRIADISDKDAVEYLDGLGSSPLRSIEFDLEKYFGSSDPSSHEKYIIFLAEYNKVPIAKVELVWVKEGNDSPTGYIRRVIVQKEFRRHGVAKALMNHVISYAKSEGIKHLDLHVFDQNVAGRTLYEHLGFSLEHVERYYVLEL